MRCLWFIIVILLIVSCNPEKGKGKDAIEQIVDLSKPASSKEDFHRTNHNTVEDTISGYSMRSLDELINREDSGFKLITEWIKDAKNQIEILPRELSKAEDALYRTQVTTRSLMGAVVYETGGILIKNGWLRILGSGNSRLKRSLPEWNKGKSFTEYGQQPLFLLIADDVVGGFFAINGGGLSSDDLGIVFYFAPDTLEWESTGKGYSDFIYWCFYGDLDLYYEGSFRKGYENDLKKISGDEMFYFTPPLWSKEGKNINESTMGIVPVQEIWELHMKN